MCACVHACVCAVCVQEFAAAGTSDFLAVGPAYSSEIGAPVPESTGLFPRACEAMPLAFLDLV